jgi:hypothetical protein
MKKNKNISSPGSKNVRKIGIIFVLVALLPALFYSAYEVSSLSSTEALIQSIYSKQLDVILFSINQYALDVTQSWSGEINALLITSQTSRVDSATRIFLNRRSAVHGVFYTDSTGHSLSFLSRQKKETSGDSEDIPVSSLQNQSETIGNIVPISGKENSRVFNRCKIIYHRCPPIKAPAGCRRRISDSSV